MFKSYIPFLYAKSIYEIPPIFFSKTLKVKYILIDLDNTLDSYKLMTPTDIARDYIKSLILEGLIPIIVSNNRGKRVKSYAEALGLTYLSKACKPFAFKINKFISLNNISKSDIIFIGDQMMTDVKACHRARIRIILTEKIVKEDQWTTHINRLIDRIIRHYHKRKGNLKNWREYHG